VTFLATLSDVFSAADRAVNGRRGGLLDFASRGLGQQLMPIPSGKPVMLSGPNGDQLISYADSVASYPAIYGVWMKLLKHLSTTEFGIYEDKRDGTFKRVFDTELETLLSEPAPGKGSVDLLQWLFNPYLVEGNGLIAKYRAEGPTTPPTGLIPLDWRYMSALARPGGPVESWVSHQIGEPREISPSEVVHLAWGAPNGSTIGMSALQALGTAIRLDDSASRYQVASFDNGSRPAGAFVLPKEAQTTPDDRAEMREQVENLHKGVDNAFRVAVLFGGIDWKPLSFTAAEAELDSTRRRSQDEVFIAYDMRRSVLAENDTGGAPDVAEILKDFHRSIVPHFDLARSAIQRQLIDPEPAWRDRRLCVRFNPGELLRGTYREEMEMAVYGYVNGVTTQDESRGRIGGEPFDTPESTRTFFPHSVLNPGSDGRTLPPSQEDPAHPSIPSGGIGKSRS
jgi:HK97 family phage portal protein